MTENNLYSFDLAFNYLGMQDWSVLLEGKVGQRMVKNYSAGTA